MQHIVKKSYLWEHFFLELVIYNCVKIPVVSEIHLLFFFVYLIVDTHYSLHAKNHQRIILKLNDAFQDAFW